MKVVWHVFSTDETHNIYFNNKSLELIIVTKNVLAQVIVLKVI